MVAAKPTIAIPESGFALFLDFDGTLVDIAETPDAVVVDHTLPGLLGRLRDRLGGAVAIVTGRPIRDIDRFLPGVMLDACGMHGLERRVVGRVSMPELPYLAGEIEGLRRRLAPLEGVLVEDKGIGVAAHWRMRPDAEGEARAAIDDLARQLGPGYRVQDGKAVREIVPVAASKGEGIRALMRVPPYAGRRPIFIGDDRTDEHGFDAVAADGGVGVKIGPGGTGATFRMGSPDELRRVLQDWAATGADIGTLELA